MRAWSCSRASTSAASSSTRNIESHKGRELDRDPQAALVFHWKSLNRQVRIRGPVEPVTDAEADAYFATPAEAGADRRLGEPAIAPLESRLAFEKAVALYAAKYALGDVPRPPYWFGLSHPAAGDRILA